MTEDEAQSYINGIAGSAARQRIGRFLDMVIAENEQQNLIARASIDHIWVRHAADSVQLLGYAEGRSGLWIDVGTGGGFPGMVVALLHEGQTMMVEPRKRRAAFLTEAAEALGIGDRVRVVAAAIERVDASATIISARAVAPIGKLLLAAQSCATVATRWILPRGRVDRQELANLQQGWRMMFHVEQSVTDADSSIVLLDGVQRR